MSGGFFLAEREHVGRPCVAEIAAVEFAHLRTIHEDHAQHRSLKTQVLQDLRGNFRKRDFRNFDPRAILFDWLKHYTELSVDQAKSSSFFSDGRVLL